MVRLSLIVLVITLSALLLCSCETQQSPEQKAKIKAEQTARDAGYKLIAEQSKPGSWLARKLDLPQVTCYGQSPLVFYLNVPEFLDRDGRRWIRLRWWCRGRRPGGSGAPLLTPARQPPQALRRGRLSGGPGLPPQAQAPGAGPSGDALAQGPEGAAVRLACDMLAPITPTGDVDARKVVFSSELLNFWPGFRVCWLVLAVMYVCLWAWHDDPDSCAACMVGICTLGSLPYSYHVGFVCFGTVTAGVICLIVWLALLGAIGNAQQDPDTAGGLAVFAVVSSLVILATLYLGHPVEWTLAGVSDWFRWLLSKIGLG